MAAPNMTPDTDDSEQDMRLPDHTTDNGRPVPSLPAELQQLLDELPKVYRVAEGSYDHAVVAAKVCLQFYLGGRVAAVRLVVDEQDGGGYEARYSVAAAGDTFAEVEAAVAGAEGWQIDYVERLDESTDAYFPAA